jgi:two-component sensor histidine kinase
VDILSIHRFQPHSAASVWQVIDSLNIFRPMIRTPTFIKGKRFWTISLLLWSLFGLFMAVQRMAYVSRIGETIPREHILFIEMVYAALWAMLTPAVLILSYSFRIEKRGWGQGVAIHLGASLLVSTIHQFVLESIVAVSFAGPPEGLSWENQVRNLLRFVDYGIMIYWALVVIEHSVRYYRMYQERSLRAAQLEAQLAEAQLQALRMQLQPHFLFNTMNAISVLIEKDPELARRTLGRLGDLLRLTLENSRHQEVTLRAELEFLDRYLQIEQTRFGDRLTVSISVDPDLCDVLVPNMILQPIVENAIKHGINRQRGAGVIEIHAVRDNEALRISIIDNGRGLDGDARVDSGVGIANIKARLEKLYGDKSKFEISNRTNGGVSAVISLPLPSFRQRICQREEDPDIDC